MAVISKSNGIIKGTGNPNLQASIQDGDDITPIWYVDYNTTPPTIYRFDDTQVSGSKWNSTPTIYADDTYLSSLSSGIQLFSAILKPTLNQGTGAITWSLINDVDHVPIFTDVITTPNANTVRIAYKEPIEKVLFFHVTPDDALAPMGVTAGASVGLEYATIHISAPWTTRQVVTYNGSAWTNSGYVFTTVTQSGTTITSTISSGGYYNSEYTYGNVQAIYAGTNNRVLRQVFSGLGYWETKWQLIDPTTGTAATPDTNDKLVLFNPQLNYTLPTQTADGQGVARRIFDPTIQPNFWISGAFLK